MTVFLIYIKWKQSSLFKKWMTSKCSKLSKIFKNTELTYYSFSSFNLKQKFIISCSIAVKWLLRSWLSIEYTFMLFSESLHLTRFITSALLKVVWAKYKPKESNIKLYYFRMVKTENKVNINLLLYAIIIFFKEM